MAQLASSLQHCYQSMHHPSLEELEWEILELLETVLGGGPSSWACPRVTAHMVVGCGASCPSSYHKGLNVEEGAQRLHHPYIYTFMTEKEVFRRRWVAAGGCGTAVDLERVLSTYDTMMEGLLGLGMSRVVGPVPLVPPPPLPPSPMAHRKVGRVILDWGREQQPKAAGPGAKEQKSPLENRRRRRASCFVSATQCVCVW